MWELRWTAKVLLFFCFCSFGLRRALELKRRAGCLRGFLSALELMERELAFSLCSVPDLLNRGAEMLTGQVKAFFCLCRETLEQDRERGLSAVWSDCLETDAISLREEDKLILREAGSVLGRYDGDSQRLALGRIRLRLEENYREAREEAERMGRVYGALGITLGMFCMILL